MGYRIGDTIIAYSSTKEIVGQVVRINRDSDNPDFCDVRVYTTYGSVAEVRLPTTACDLVVERVGGR